MPLPGKWGTLLLSFQKILDCLGLPPRVAPMAFNKKARLLWINAGTIEEVMHQCARTCTRTLDQAGMANVFIESKGRNREFRMWSRGGLALYDFAVWLFKRK
jgi:hypothetical protein